MHYQLHELRYVGYLKDLLSGVTLARIDQALLEQGSLKNHQNVLDWILGNWGTMERFETHALGMCIRNQTAIISWCLMDCRLGDQAEIGIQTDPAYRRQGLGAITVAATVAACLAQGIRTIGWHCVATNIGSRKVAEKVGFRHCVDYVAYTPYPPIENETDLTPAQWEEWAIYYENANRVQPRFSWIIVECWAKAQNIDRTIYHLKQMIATGWKSTRQELSQIELFRRFHETEEWKQFLDLASTTWGNTYG
jgi:GNAT superfamily N-acetyltransferase